MVVLFKSVYSATMETQVVQSHGAKESHVS